MEKEKVRLTREEMILSLVELDLSMDIDYLEHLLINGHVGYNNLSIDEIKNDYEEQFECEVEVVEKTIQ